MSKRWAAGILLVSGSMLWSPIAAQAGTPTCFGEVATVGGATSGPDVLTGTSGHDVIIGLGGNDTISGLGGDDFLCGNGGGDTIQGGDGIDKLNGGGGDDGFDGGPLADTVSFAGSLGVTANLTTGNATGQGADTFVAVENLIGSPQEDFLIGNSVKNVLSGGGGADSLLGENGRDTLNGGTGGDSLQGGLNGDSFIGGPGTDIADYSHSATPVTVNLQTGQGTGEGADVLAEVEVITGSSFDDTLTASDTGSTINAGGGNYSVIGGASVDTLRAGDDFAFDTVEGRGGNDTIDFGSYNHFYDTISYEHAPSSVEVDLGAATATGGDGTDTLVSVPYHVIGSGFADHIVGDGNYNRLFGLSGPDTLEGGASGDDVYPGLGNDTIDGGTEGDTVHYEDGTPTASIGVDLALGTATGGSGTDDLSAIENVVGSGFGDVIKGDSLNNSLDGAAGDDTLYGRDGDDTLNGGDGSDTINGGNGTDSCTGEFVTLCP